MRFERLAVLTVILTCLVSCSPAAPPTGPDAAKALIEASAAAMGGWANIDAVKSQEILTGGGDWEPMQAPAPTADALQVDIFGQTILIDLEKNRVRVINDGKRSYPAPAPVKFTEVITPEAAMVQTTGADGKVTNEHLHASRLATRLRDMNRLPIRVLKVAKAAPELTRAADINVDKKTYHVLKYKDSGLAVELHIDSFNKLPSRVIYTEDDPIYGDTQNQLSFDDFKDVQGVRLPNVYVTSLNGKKIREERIRTLISNPKYDEASFAIPADIKAQPEVGERIVSQWTLRRAAIGVGYQDFGRTQNVKLDELAKGVYHVTGGTHHSLAVEMKDYVVVVELPLFDERSTAVIKAIEEKIPGKPIKYGVITHYHIDHSGGLRGYAAKGATLLAEDSIVPFVKETLGRPHTVRPDSLAKAGGNKGTVEGVKDMKEITDGERAIQLIAIPNGHATGMLAAYLPKEKLIFVSDLYTPGAPTPPGDANAVAFNAAIEKAKLAVDRVVGGHGGVGPYKDLAKVGAVPKS